MNLINNVVGITLGLVTIAVMLFIYTKYKFYTNISYERLNEIFKSRKRF